METEARDQPENGLPTALAKPAQRALAGAGYNRIEQLGAVRVSEIKRLHGIGPKAIGQLRDALAAKGLSFADEKPNREMIDPMSAATSDP